ncbi:MAG: nuclear transport factor 2 family protein [Gemmatimonadetes bacterium]|nr:nuclear transport factor 2 family protein [Gemmatimonadota bacterium]NNK62041.1 nuclear transport factor 2 family protein [Gemmatimonadota bacterium]
MSRSGWLVSFGAVLALCMPLTPISAQTMDSAQTIRDLRSQSNAALRSGDIDAFMASIDTDYVGTAGNGGHIRSHAELRALVDGVAANPRGLYFVRTPDELELDEAGGRAIEMGRWAGRETVAGAEQSAGQGRYTAYWRRVGGEWVIHAEVFVTLPASDGAVSR